MSAQDPVEIDQTTDFMWKATAAVATLASGFVAEKVVALGWRAITGRPAPREEDQLLNYKLAEVGRKFGKHGCRRRENGRPDFPK